MLLPAVLVMIVACVCAIFASHVSPYDPHNTDARQRLIEPSIKHPMGTDRYGRDVLSRVIHGARYSLFIGLAVALLALAVGGAAGLLAGYLQYVDTAIMRIMDALMAMPSLMLALVLVSAMGAGYQSVIIALSFTYLPRVARVARSSTLAIRDTLFVESARAIGASTRRIMFRHIVPNILSPIIVQVTLVFAFALIAEATLSFLGVGVPPGVPTWGSSIAEGRDYIVVAPWLTVWPGLVVVFVVLSLNIIGDVVRDELDPKLSRSVK